MASNKPPVCATGVSLIATGCLSGVTPRGQPWTSAGTLPHGGNGLNARRMAVLSTFRAPSLCRPVHCELLRSVWLDLSPIIAATACNQRNYVERYSRSKLKEGNRHVAPYRRAPRDACPRHTRGAACHRGTAAS